MQKYNPGSACAECSTQEKHKGQIISKENFDAILSLKYEQNIFRITALASKWIKKNEGTCQIINNH